MGNVQFILGLFPGPRLWMISVQRLFLFMPAN